MNRRPENLEEAGFSETDTPWVDGLTIGQVLRQTAKRFPTGDGCVFCSLGLRLSWQDLDHEVDKVARGLLALGFQPGDHFGVWATNVPEWVLLQFATARIGVVLVTINPSYRTSEVAYVMHQSELRGLALVDRFKASDYFATLSEVAFRGSLNSVKNSCPTSAKSALTTGRLKYFTLTADKTAIAATAINVNVRLVVFIGKT